MIIRNCSGGIVFYGDKVLLLMNDKRDIAFPKGVVRDNRKLTEVAVERVKIEAGVKARIISPCGKTHYEFYSVTRRKPVHNNVSWFVMEADSDKVTPNASEGFEEGAFYPIEEAMSMITYSQDRSLLMMAYQKYKESV
ncbi:MAG: NUDIX domain-containing protein [Clostridiales bacterium]|nr:NUDIX domain-containing protein [Clostridiales bacterium]